MYFTLSGNKLGRTIAKNCQNSSQTGSSGKNKDGLTGAKNDIAIITLPNGNITISIFVVTSMESYDVNCKMISDISKWFTMNWQLKYGFFLYEINFEFKKVKLNMKYFNKISNNFLI